MVCLLLLPQPNPGEPVGPVGLAPHAIQHRLFMNTQGPTSDPVTGQNHHGAAAWAERIARSRAVAAHARAPRSCTKDSLASDNVPTNT